MSKFWGTFLCFWKNRWVLRSLLSSIYFNFKYLPILQAIRLPILLYKPHFFELKGSIRIEGTVRTGMIQLGRNLVSLFPNSGFTFENHGGEIIFCGHCIIGNHSSLSIGKNGRLLLGKNFHAYTSLKMTCYSNIQFSDNVLFGWDCIVSDTDFHAIELLNGELSMGYGTIKIGKNVWVGMRSFILKNTIIPDCCIIGANSLVSKSYSESRCLLAGQPAIVKKRGVSWNPDNDEIIYKNIE